MKILLLFFSISFLINSCQQIDKFTQFDMEYYAEVTVPATVGINLPVDLLTPSITSNAEQQFALNDTRKDLIEEIYLKQLDLNITTPSNADFSFLEEITVYINADGLPETEIAVKLPVPNDTGYSLSLDCSQSDIQEYIKKDNFSLKLTTVTDELLTQDYQIQVYAVFFVDAKILGL